MRYTGKPFVAGIRSGDMITTMDVSSGEGKNIILYSRVCPDDGSIQVIGMHEMSDEEVRRYAEALSNQCSSHMQQFYSKLPDREDARVSQLYNRIRDGVYAGLLEFPK